MTVMRGWKGAVKDMPQNFLKEMQIALTLGSLDRQLGIHPGFLGLCKLLFNRSESDLQPRNSIGRTGIEAGIGKLGP